MNQAHVVCLPSQASSHPLARGRALLGRACQEQFLAPARQPPVSACLHLYTECAALAWLGCMFNALHSNNDLKINICCSESHLHAQTVQESQNAACTVQYCKYALLIHVFVLKHYVTYRS